MRALQSDSYPVALHATGDFVLKHFIVPRVPKRANNCDILCCTPKRVSQAYNIAPCVRKLAIARFFVLLHSTAYLLC